MSGESVIQVFGRNDSQATRRALRFFKERGLKVLGVDPAERIAAAATASGVETIPASTPPALGIALGLSAAVVVVIGVYPQLFARIGEVAFPG